MVEGETEKLEEGETEKEGEMVRSRRRLTKMGDVCKISRQSQEEEEDIDGAKDAGEVGERTGRARDRKDHSDHHLRHIDSPTRHGLKVVALNNAKLSAKKQIWFALKVHQDRWLSATNTSVFDFVETKKRWKS